MRHHRKGDFRLGEELKVSEELILTDLEALFMKAMERRVKSHEGKRLAVAFSGGIDSTLIALALKRMKADFMCYTAAYMDTGYSIPRDLVWAGDVAKELELPLKVLEVSIEQADPVIREVMKIIKEPDVVKVGVGATGFVVGRAAKKDGCVALFTGLGSEEIYAGYYRHEVVLKQGKNVNEECLRGLHGIYARDVERDVALCEAAGLELLVPFLDNDLIDYSLRIPFKHKITPEQKKIILRKLAIRMGIPTHIAERKKLAAQYGSNLDKAIDKAARKHGFKYKKQYLTALMKELS